MGKNRAKRFGALKSTPTGLLSEKEAELNDELQADPADNIPSTISNILEKIQSPGTEERACGCQLMSNIVSQPKAIGSLLQNNIVKITAPLFLDPNLDVSKSALGALRNMCVHGNDDVCEVMVKEDILTPLIALIRKFGQDWTPEKGSSKYVTASDVLTEAFELLSFLCESNNAAVRVFNKEGLIEFLLPGLKYEVFGSSLSNAAARCLHVVSENNPDVTSKCEEASVLSQLLSIASSSPTDTEGLYFRTLVTGTILNLNGIDLTTYYKGIIQGISEVLALDCMPLMNTTLEARKESKDEDFDSLEQSWKNVDRLVTAQGVCLELLANMCCSEDEEWEDLEEENSGESADDLPVEASLDVDMAGDARTSLCLQSEIYSAVIAQDVLKKILQKSSPLEEGQVSVLKASASGKEVITKLVYLQARALLCLSNIVSALDESALTSSVPLPSIWTDLHKLANSPQASENEDYKLAVTCAMRAVLQQMADLSMLKSQEVTEADLQFLITLAQDSQNRETQINIVRIISTIGCMLSLSEDIHPLLKDTGKILMQVACDSKDLVVTSEALDSLFDVFKEDHTDPVVKEIGLVKSLKELQPSFKTKVTGQRKKLGDHYAVVMTAKSNLAGFIKYKSSRK